MAVICVVAAILFTGFVALRTGKSHAAVNPGNAKKIYSSLRASGYTHYGAMAVVGTFSCESGLKPGAHNPAGYYGLAQWGGGRASALFSFAKKHGSSWSSLGIQIAYFKQEVRKYGMYGSLKNAKSVGAGVRAMLKFEGNPGSYYGSRLKRANSYAGTLKGLREKYDIELADPKDTEALKNPHKKRAGLTGVIDESVTGSLGVIIQASQTSPTEP